MVCPAVEIAGKKVVLLSGYQRLPQVVGDSNRSMPIQIQAMEKLRKSASAHPDAVAFGYLAGRWVASA